MNKIIQGVRDEEEKEFEVLLNKVGKLCAGHSVPLVLCIAGALAEKSLETVGDDDPKLGLGLARAWCEHLFGQLNKLFPGKFEHRIEKKKDK